MLAAGARGSPGLTVASVPATEEVSPTSVPGHQGPPPPARAVPPAPGEPAAAGAGHPHRRWRRRSRPACGCRCASARRPRTPAAPASRPAGRAARLLFSYDYRTLDKDFATGRTLTTGSFRTDYDKTTTKVVADVAKRYKAVVKANVINAGVVSASPTTVVTVVYVNQVTSSTQVKGEKVDLSRVRMTLVRADDVWLVTKVDAL